MILKEPIIYKSDTFETTIFEFQRTKVRLIYDIERDITYVWNTNYDGKLSYNGLYLWKFVTKIIGKISDNKLKTILTFI